MVCESEGVLGSESDDVGLASVVGSVVSGLVSESLANGAELRIVRNEQSEPLFKFVEQEDDFEDEDEVQKYTVDFNF